MAMDRDQLIQGMLAKAGPMAPPEGPNEGQEDQDPKALVDKAIEQISSYAQNPDQVTPETIQEVLNMLQQASSMLGA